MEGSVFRSLDLAGATFDNVNLANATFNNVNLADVTIRDANMSGLTIEGVSLEGMTIDGIRVRTLVEAEKDRLDPERDRLRMADPFDCEDVKRVMARLDEVRAAFYARLWDTPAEQLNHNSGPDAWSALEHTRHMVFAEELYTDRWILRNDRPWSKLGMLPPFLEHETSYADVGVEPTGDLETVLAAWDAAHAETHAFLANVTLEDLCTDTREIDFGQNTIAGILQGLANHDLLHIRMAEAALERAADIEDQ
ncbi:MAG: DinB family protein [Anaerolineae bacterium]|nr:DinB family protein [Anaerolineae bacterium]